MTVTENSTEVLDALDWHPPCEVARCQDEHPPATHLIRWRTDRLPCACCQRSVLACPRCVERTLAGWETVLPHLGVCMDCGRVRMMYDVPVEAVPL